MPLHSQALCLQFDNRPLLLNRGVLVLGILFKYLKHSFNAILHYPASMVRDDFIRGQIRAEQVGNIKRYLSSMMLANAANALIVVVGFWASSQRWAALFWATPILIFAAHHGLKHRTALPARPSYVSSRVISRAVRNALLLGSLWAVLPLSLFSHAAAPQQMIIACLCSGMLGGGAFAFATIPFAAIAFSAPIVFGSAVAIERCNDPSYLLIALLMISYLAVLLRGVFIYAAQIATKVASQIYAERKARRDELTNLPNRLAFHERLEDAFSRLARMHEPFAVLCVDLNDFKAVNDRWGHATGDQLLVQVSQRLMTCTRNIDLVARLAGDEFAILLANTACSEDAAAIAECIVRSVDGPFVIDGVNVFSGACIGIAVAPADGNNRETLLKNADQALYAAKNGTNGPIRIYDFAHKERMRLRRTAERDLRSAFRKSEFFLVFQPILELANNRVTGAEALLRWKHPKDGVKSPAEFINIIEETGLIHEIGDWAIRQACRAAAQWPEHIRVAVNISPTQLRLTSILSSVASALEESGLLPSRLELEITETALVDNNDNIASNLKSLHELGVRIALDDFGTGYSSLTYLQKLSPDSIKIDASFVREMVINADCASIVKSMIALSRDLRINVVAEGIENHEQLLFLHNISCKEGQGYLLYSPKSLAEVSTVFLNGNVLRAGAACA